MSNIRIISEEEENGFDTTTPEQTQAEDTLKQKNEEAEKQFEDRNELTGIDPKGPNSLGRKKILMVASVAFVAIVVLGMFFSMAGGNRADRAVTQDGGFAANVPRDFLRQEMERSLRTPGLTDADFDNGGDDDLLLLFNDWALPPQPPQQPQQEVIVIHAPPPQQHPGQQPRPQYSALVPRIEGHFIGQVAIPTPIPQQQPPGIGARPLTDEELLARMQMPNIEMPDFAALAGAFGGGAGGFVGGDQFHHAAQMAQQNREQFANVAISTDFAMGTFLPHNVLWIGTIIPAVLVTAINSDMPGNVIARVTSNVFDSQTGTSMLIPQGTLLVATYNSSVSPGQNRVQIAWDLMIRPDGYMIELGGMNAVDSAGMAGMPAVVRENWFEYLRAAGIMSAFSVINATMADQVGRIGSEEMVLGVLTANQEFIRDIGGNLVSRAMSIQPTLTVESGTRINILTNRNMFLPPMERFPVTQPHRITRR
jgi:type IV secretory pathway VirB10-like protein